MSKNELLGALLALLVGTAQAQVQDLCGVWRPGTGLTVEGTIRHGWVHSRILGKHELHIKGGTIRVFDQDTRTFTQLEPKGAAILYHRLNITAPAGAVLEWTRPDGVREPVPSIYLYP
jgi:hypothetical protein